jgi:hypothetical protein
MASSTSASVTQERDAADQQVFELFNRQRQDPQVNLDGTIPTDNPLFNEPW